MKTPKLALKKSVLQKSHGPETYWKVTSPKQGGGSSRRFFKDKAEAQTFLDQQKTELVNFGTAGAAFPQKLRGEALAAEDLLSPLGLSVRDAAKFYADHMKKLQGGIPLADAVELLEKSREGEEYSKEYTRPMLNRLKHFVEAFPNKTTTGVSKLEISKYLSGYENAETRKSHRRNINTLFKFLIQNHGHATNPVPAAESGKLVAEMKWSVEVLTPVECYSLLHAADAATITPLALGMFCGLRASEIERLDWKKIRLAERQIVVDRDVARKTGSRRVVPIPDACADWISPHVQKSGPVHPDKFLDLFDVVRIAAGFRPSNTRHFRRLEAKRLKENPKADPLSEWPNNCLRHSAISYAMADCGDEYKVATWAGNTPRMIKRHYDAQVTPSDAVKFYALSPKTAKNVRAFRPAAKTSKTSKPARVSKAA